MGVGMALLLGCPYQAGGLLILAEVLGVVEELQYIKNKKIRSGVWTSR